VYAGISGSACDGFKLAAQLDPARAVARDVVCCAGDACNRPPNGTARGGGGAGAGGTPPPGGLRCRAGTNATGFMELPVALAMLEG
jgi:hypothetical protein